MLSVGGRGLSSMSDVKVAVRLGGRWGSFVRVDAFRGFRTGRGEVGVWRGRSVGLERKGRERNAWNKKGG